MSSPLRVKEEGGGRFQNFEETTGPLEIFGIMAPDTWSTNSGRVHCRRGEPSSVKNLSFSRSQPVSRICIKLNPKDGRKEICSVS